MLKKALKFCFSRDHFGLKCFLLFFTAAWIPFALGVGVGGGEIVNSGIQHLNLYEKIILVEKLDCCVINSTVKLYSSKHSAALLKHTAVCAFETEGFLEGGKRKLLSSGE